MWLVCSPSPCSCCPRRLWLASRSKIAALAPMAVVLVVDANGDELVAQNADGSFVPASVTKIVTAWLAMEVLGGDYRFETRFYLDDKRTLYVGGAAILSWSRRSWRCSRKIWSPKSASRRSPASWLTAAIIRRTSASRASRTTARPTTR